MATERCQTDRVAAEPHAPLWSQDTGRPRAPSPAPPSPGRRVGCGPQPLLLETLRGRGLQVRRAQEGAKQEPVRWTSLVDSCPLARGGFAVLPPPGRGPARARPGQSGRWGAGFWAPGREQEALPHLLSSLGGDIYLGSQPSLLELPSRCHKENFKQRTVE